MSELDIENEIRLQERKSASGDRRWRAFTTNGQDYDGFGATAEDALQDFVRINNG